jgi:hypothetical protein
MSHYEQRQKELREKFGIDKLLMTDEFRFSEHGKPAESRHYKTRLEYLQAKYGMDGLAVEGMEKPKKRTLADDIRLRDVEQARGEKLFAIAGEGIRKEPMRFWVSVKFN